MKLISLRLKNFRQHQDSTIRFADGMTAIVGPNGSGKTTILEAITFALYGVQRDKKETIRFLRATDKQFGVELKFSFDGRQYRVMRTDRKAELSEMLEGDKKVRAEGLRDVNHAVHRLLRLNYHQFVNSFCAEQKKLKFLDFESTRLQEEIAKMLGYDRLKSAAELCKNDATRAKSEADGMEQGMGDLEQAKSEVAKSKATVRSATEGLRAAEGQVAESSRAESEKRVIRAKAEDYLAKQAARTACGARLAGLEASLEGAKKAVESASAEAAEYARLAPIEIEVEQKKKESQRFEELRAASEQARLLADRRDRLAQAIESEAQALARMENPDVAALEADVGKALSALTSARKEWKEAESDWQSERKAAEAALAEAAKEEEMLAADLVRAEQRAADGKCPECGQAIGKGYLDSLEVRRRRLECVRERLAAARNRKAGLEALPSALSELQRQVEAAEKAHARAQADHERGKAQADAYRRAAENLEAKRAELTGIEKEIAKSPVAYDEVAHQKVKARLEELEAPYKRRLELAGAAERLSQANSEVEKVQAVLAEAVKERDRLAAELAALGFSGAEAAQEAVAAHAEAAKTLAVAVAHRDAATKTLAEAEASLAAAEQRMKKLEEIQQRLRELRRDQLHFQVTGKQLTELRERLNHEIRPELEARAADNLAALTDGRYPRIQLTEDFSARLYDGDLTKDVISGGEEDILAIALRLALAELIQERNGVPLTLLILDEVFGSLDESRRSNVLERLAGLKGRFDQILVISHIEEINQVADQCLYVALDPRTGASVVSEVAEGEETVTLPDALFD